MTARVVAAAVLILLPEMARAQQQESAPPPPTLDPRRSATARPSIFSRRTFHANTHSTGCLEHIERGGGGGSWTPRASGFRPGVSLKTFGIEKRLRGHVYPLNVSNSLGTTVAEMARGAA